MLSSKYKLLAPIAFLFLLQFVVYHFGHARFGVEGFESGDHRTLMNLRATSQSEAEFIWKAANFDRYRGNSQSFLFRPGLTVVLAVIDILFRTNFFVMGGISLIMGAVIASLLFFLLRPILPWWGALLAAAVFETHYCGSELVIWRHVAPYGWGLFFFALGGLALFRQKLWWAGLAFFLSTTFHETYAAACFLLIPVGFISLFQKEWSIPRKSWLAVFLGPCLLFGALDLGSLLWVDIVEKGGTYSSPKLFNGVFDYVVRWVEGFICMVGASITDFIVPQVFTTTMIERRYGILVMGPIALVLMAWAFRRLIQDGKKETALVYLLLAAHSLTLCAAYTSMRIIPDDLYAIGRSHYYRYYTNFTFIVMFAAIVSRPVPVRWGRVLVGVLLTAVISNQLFFGVMRLRRLGKRSDPREYRVALNMRAASRFLKEHGCFDGNQTKEVEKFLPTPFLYRQSCEYRRSGEKYTGERLADEKVISTEPIFRSY